VGKPIITAKVGNLTQEGWIDIYADGWYIGCVWGKGKVQYDSTFQVFGKYRLDVNGTDTYLWLDAIQRRIEAVEPIKQEAVC